MHSVRVSPDGVCGPGVRARPVLPHLQERYVTCQRRAGANARPTVHARVRLLLPGPRKTHRGVSVHTSLHTKSRACSATSRPPGTVGSGSVVRQVLSRWCQPRVYRREVLRGDIQFPQLRRATYFNLTLFVLAKQFPFPRQIKHAG